MNRDEDVQQRLNHAILYALREGCFFPVPEPQACASTREWIRWGAMRHLHMAIADFCRVTPAKAGTR